MGQHSSDLYLGIADGDGITDGQRHILIPDAQHRVAVPIDSLQVASLPQEIIFQEPPQLQGIIGNQIYRRLRSFYREGGRDILPIHPAKRMPDAGYLADLFSQSVRDRIRVVLTGDGEVWRRVSGGEKAAQQLYQHRECEKQNDTQSEGAGHQNQILLGRYRMRDAQGGFDFPKSGFRSVWLMGFILQISRYRRHRRNS